MKNGKTWQIHRVLDQGLEVRAHYFFPCMCSSLLLERAEVMVEQATVHLEPELGSDKSSKKKKKF